MNRIALFLKFRLGFAAGLFLAAACGLCFLAAGCGPSNKNSGGRNNAGPVVDLESCDQQLDGALAMLLPENLGLSADRDRAVDILNGWLNDCGSLIAAPPAQVSPLLERELPAETLQLVRAEGFLDRDGSHIRDCLLLKETAQFALGAATNDLARVVNLFHYVVRNVQLVDDRPSGLPLTTHDVLMLGRGNAEDRGWVFVNLLKQLRIDAVLLQAAGARDGDESAESERPWLIGVLLDGDVYLFDAQLGSPVPSPADDGSTLTVSRPATLNEAAADPAILELGSENGNARRLRGSDLEQLRVLLVGDASFWAPRMNRLQSALTGSRSAVVYEALEDADEIPGLLTRVVSAGSPHWQADDVALWLYPERQLAGHEHMDDDQRSRYRSLQHAFIAPVPIVEINPETLEMKFGPATRLQLKTRTMQLIGEYPEAIRDYLRIRASDLLPPFPGEHVPEELKPILRVKVSRELRDLHERAAHDAYFWVGVCQFEQDKFDMAAKTFASYLERFPQGRWLPSARYLLALIHHDHGEHSQAVEQLRRIPENDPQAAGFRLLRQRAERLAEAEAER